MLLGGVVARYVFNRPLEWSDELAQALALWLAMLGAVIALRRGEHMRLTVLSDALPPKARIWVQALASCIALAFLVLLVPAAFDHFENQWPVLSSALGFHDGLRVAAILVGAVLMALVSLRQLSAHARLMPVLVCAAAVAGTGFVLSSQAGVFEDLGQANLVLFFVLLLGGCVAIGVPIAFAFGLATVAFLGLSTDIPPMLVPSRMDEGMSSLVLLAVPLFVLLGALMEMTGMATAMVGFLASLLGHVRGGLDYVLLGAMYLVSGISGSKTADMAAIAPSLLPEMRRRGAHEGDLVSLLSASCAMSETIPPSLVLITIGSVTGVSITGLFTGGLLPAVVGMAALGVVVFAQTRGQVPAATARPTGRAVLRSFVLAVPALALPFVIRTVVAKGVATATEVATIGVMYAVAVGLLVYRTFDWRRVYPILVETASLSGAILLIIGSATAMAWALTQSGFSHQLVEAMKGVPGGKWGFMAISVVVFILLGSMLEGIPAVVLFGPLLFPVARSLGIHEVHYAMTVVFAMGLGLFAPPLGIGFYAACAIGRTSPDQVIGRVWTHLGALGVALVVIATIPWISIGFLD